MRPDSVGIFWQDMPDERGRIVVPRMMPDIPYTEWKPVWPLPNLSRAKILTIDSETKDPGLIEYGPGWARGTGHIVGVAIGADNDGRWYFPLRHEVEPEWNYPLEPTLRWLRETLGRPEQPKIGAHLLYDVGWLRQEGVIVRGTLYDVQYAEALLSERSLINLETLAQKYLLEGKIENDLVQWLADFYGGRLTDQKKNIYRSPPRLCAPYAIGDVDLPYRILHQQWPLLYREGLLDLFAMENALIYLLVEMRFAGVTVDIPRAEQVRNLLLNEEKQLAVAMKQVAGCEVNINAAATLKQAFDHLGLSYPHTEKGAPSFTKGFLETVQHPIGELIREYRKVQRTRTTFIESYILESHVHSKVYPQFHPLRGADFGTRSGRFASSTPNYENLPARDERIGPLVRSCVVPDEGHPRWRRWDYNQIEYRFLAHYAVGFGSDALRQRFCSDPKTDYHEMLREMIRQTTGQDIGRKLTKNINFGLIFGMGLKRLAEYLKLPAAQANTLFANYHNSARFVSATMKATMQEAQQYGIITTILGRRSHFDLWEPAWRQGEDETAEDRMALPYEKAMATYGQVKRAYTYKALNRRLQGSAADLIKKGMLTCWEQGVYTVTGVPRIPVHDELDFSDPGGADNAFDEGRRIMETAIRIAVPVTMTEQTGPNWGSCA